MSRNSGTTSYYPIVSARSTLTDLWTLTASRLYEDSPTLSLTIDRQGSGTGGISASGLTCPGSASTQALPCGTTYPVGTVVTLTAQPDTGSTFLGWAGACSGTGPCQVTLSTHLLAAAVFSQTPATVAVSYYHTDAIGSVRAITDAAGATVIRHDYMAFGEDTQPLTGDPQRFGGMQLDPESALNYAGARYYRVSWGRFTQVDPIGGSLTNPQRWNGYAYALNNPLNYVDPMGMTASWTQDGDPCAMHGLGDDCYDSEMYSCWANGCNTPGRLSENQQQSMSDFEDMMNGNPNPYSTPSNTPSSELLGVESGVILNMQDTPEAPPSAPDRFCWPDSRYNWDKTHSSRVCISRELHGHEACCRPEFYWSATRQIFSLCFALPSDVYWQGWVYFVPYSW